MHANSKTAIKGHLADFFQSATSTDAIPLNLSVIKAAIEIHKSKKKYVSQVEIQIVIGDFIKDAVTKKNSGFSNVINNNISFISLFEVQELSDLTDEIIYYFDSLPRNYTCVFILPNVISAH